MHVISRKTLREFGRQHADAADRLDVWYRIVKAAGWETPADVKAAFASASFLPKNVVVFNVGGNNYRVVAGVDYGRQKVYIRHVLTHREYDILSSAGKL